LSDAYVSDNYLVISIRKKECEYAELWTLAFKSGRFAVEIAKLDKTS
jgi:hypothetical protein